MPTQTEKEKMLAGDPYKSGDATLFHERQSAKEILYNINHLRPQQLDERNRLFRQLFGSIKETFFIEPPFYCDYGYNIIIGNNFYANHNLTILDCAVVNIGNNVLIGPGVGIYAAGHPLHPFLRNKELEYALPVNIGDNVWIGGGVIINPGITIGDNAVIGSGSVVTKDIPGNMLAVGNPCKAIRAITDADRDYYYKNYRQ